MAIYLCAGEGTAAEASGPEAFAVNPALGFGGSLTNLPRTTPARVALLLALSSGNVKANTVKLSPQPVIADANFVAYGRTNYTIEITLKAARKLEGKRVKP